MNEIKTTYRDIEITYIESGNMWNCELFSKPAVSLAAAKERIDKKLDTEKKAPFKRFQAYVPRFGWRNQEPWLLVEITSVADDGKSVRVTLNGACEKISQRAGRFEVYPVTPENTALVEEIKRQQAIAYAANQAAREAQEKLTPWKP